MLAPAHVMLHVGFCSAIARMPSDTTVAIRVQLVDRTGRQQFNRTFRVSRDDDPQAILEFDSPFGVYHATIVAPRYGCVASDYLNFIAGHERSITEQLSRNAPAPSVPTLLSGTAPQSFLYVQPTFVLFDKSAAVCKKPIPALLPTNIRVENDQDAYYAWLYNDAGRPAGSDVLALRLATPTHEYHYVRLPLSYPTQPYGWPAVMSLNVSQDMIDALAFDPVNTLLCPKIWQTSVS